MSELFLLGRDAAASDNPSRISLLRLGLTAYRLLLPVALFFAFSHWGYDDPFITYRYAENIVSGRGFVYNPGEQVLSTTTPLFVLLLSALSNPWISLPQLAILVSSVSTALGGIFLWDLGASWKLPWVSWAGLLLFPTFPLVLSTTGSETPLYLALCLGAFAFYNRKRLSIAAVFSALAVLTRPDGILVPLLLAAHYGLTGGVYSTKGGLSRSKLREFLSSFPWNSILLFIVISLPWFVFSFIYFGSLVPVTLTAKQAQGEMAISQRFLPGMLTLLRDYSSWPYRLEACLGFIGLFWLPRSSRTTVLFLAWTVLYFAAYSLLGVSRYFWYYAPLVPGFIVLVGLGLSALSQDWFKGSSPASSISKYLAAGFLALMLVAQVSTLIRMRASSDNRLSIYRETGEWLADHTAPEDSVGVLEVGIIGYYARRPMVDFAGLVQPQVASQFSLHTTYADSALWALENYRPRYVVLQEGLFPEIEKGYLSEYCFPVETISNAVHSYPYPMVIYDCR